MWVFQKYTKVSLRKIRLHFPSKKIHPCKNFARVAIKRSASFKPAKSTQKIISVKTCIICRGILQTWSIFAKTIWQKGFIMDGRPSPKYRCIHVSYAMQTNLSKICICEKNLQENCSRKKNLLDVNDLWKFNC